MKNPLAKKFQLKEEFSILLMNPDPDIHSLFEGIRIESSSGNSEQFDSVILFIRNKVELNKWIPEANKKRTEKGQLWICYPKKSGPIKTDLNRDITWKELQTFGLEPVRLISLNEDWSSMRAVNKKDRKKPSRFGQDPPGVDRATKTVIPPENLQHQLDKNPEAKTFFDSLAFSHKREYVAWILGAKKEETKQRAYSKHD